jgi:hypothetical protein
MLYHEMRQVVVFLIVVLPPFLSLRKLISVVQGDSDISVKTARFVGRSPVFQGTKRVA